MNMISVVNCVLARLAIGGSLLAILSSPLLSATVSTEQDLTAVIALQGQPCGKVVSSEKRGENDFVARCSSGDVYRVYVDPSGRVRVEKQK
jgi:hypothetical protein